MRAVTAPPTRPELSQIGTEHEYWPSSFTAVGGISRRLGVGYARATLKMIGAHRIECELGRGGMGVVYLARDTRLDRLVAIKTLPAHLAGDPDRLTRFEREAKIVASLNHPGIAAVYALEGHDGNHFLVMEYVAGETLAARLKHGRFPADEALQVAIQIAQALEAAHERGVIHRDLKPGNVMLTPDGKTKVLDFGLARSTEHLALNSGSTPPVEANSPTMTVMTSAAYTDSPTIPGAILGTAGYMSPEQARGKPVDKRSDIFSFGCVLYEMLTGRGPFHGETPTDSLGAIVHKEPDWSRLPPETPIRIRELLADCLAKDRSLRLRDIGDARLAIERAASEDPGVQPTRPRASRREIAAWIAGLVGVAVAIGMFVARRTADSGDRISELPAHMQIIPEFDTRLVTWGDLAGPAVVSPDGATLAFVAQPRAEPQRLWVRRLDEPAAESLPGTEGANFPFWSPDGRQLGFFTTGRLRAIDLTTRSIRTVCEARGGRGGTWTPSGFILFSPDFQSAIMKVPAEGGSPTQITQLQSGRHTSHRWPYAFPDGEHFLFTAVSHEASRRDEDGLYLGSLDGMPPTPIIRAQSSAQYIDGRLLFVRDGTLLSVPMDECTGRLSGDPTPVLSRVATDLTTWRAGFSASAAGTLAYSRAERSAPTASGIAATGMATRIAQHGRDGRPRTYLFEGVPNDKVRVSPDGLKLATSATPTGATNSDIWICDVLGAEGTTLSGGPVQTSRVTFGPGDKQSPVWSPDGREIAYASGSPSAGRTAGIYIKSVTGGTDRLALEREDDGADVWPEDWSRDGRYLLYVRGSWVSTGRNDIWALPVGGGQPLAVVATHNDDQSPVLSPDGRWIAYQTQEANGVGEVYIEPFAPAWDKSTTRPAPGSRWRVSLSGGGRPRWSADGKELFYLNSTGSIVVLRVVPDGDALRFEDRADLFQISGDPLAADFDVSPDGKYVFVQDLDIPSDRAIFLVLNWQRLLRR